ncbi:glycosyltransferase [Desulfobulbus elongatus]|uniref:glycosyltransferase n=1 Tax=Desulfobulbus elongatus TaxID=53332 RepID=UPI0009FD95A8|nr:glycosyltransferase [Desulfobulbus elongatus]
MPGAIGVICPTDFIKRLPFGGASGFIQNALSAINYPIVIFGAGVNGTPLWTPQLLCDNVEFVATYAHLFPSRYPLRLRSLQGYLSSRRRILKSGVSLLYVHSPECALPFLFGDDRLPVVFHQHGSGNPVTSAKYSWARNRSLEQLFDQIHRTIYRRADWIIAIDRLCQDQVVENGAGNKVNLIMNAVDRGRFRPDPESRAIMRGATGCCDDELVILFVGRLEEIKQVDRLIKGVAEFRRKIREKCRVRLLIAGDGTCLPALVQLRDTCGLADVVSFLGKVPHDRLPGYYNAADVLVLPSRMEGVPMVVLESLACGTPVIAATVGGIPELVRNGENGILLDQVTPESIATALADISVQAPQPVTISATVARWGTVEVGAELSTIFSKFVGL